MKKLFLSVLMCLMALVMNAQKCAVLEFRGSASVSVADIDGISEMFMTYFRPAGYTMIERAQIDKVISEQNFQRSNITDNQAVQLGKILNASVVVLGKVSKLGGQYQVDVRAVNVQYGQDMAFEGATFSGDYRTNVRNLATKLAGKMAITQGPTIQPTQAPRKRSSVEVLYGYLKIFPNELGSFESEPSSVIAQINKQTKYGYNNWRIPTNEELALLRANGYLGTGQYMTCEKRSGNVLLVTDGDDYSTLKKAEDEAQKAEETRKAEELRRAEEEAQRAKEARQAELRAEGWIDLGLPSGLLWKNRNEYGLYDYYEAKNKFSGKLPTKEQWEELMNMCQLTFENNKAILSGPNGNRIELPAEGIIQCAKNDKNGVGTLGMYMSISASEKQDFYWTLVFSTNTETKKLNILPNADCWKKSVRLVKKP